MVHIAPNLDIFDGWLGLDADAIICRAERIDGLPIAHLSDVAAYRRLLNRPKDRLHHERLEPYLLENS
ncbi:MAG: hypothetical protein AVDCRST_MAG86-2155 [uncultured Truepera sp.]|uniref:Uncharacterized protein n=1 Tax=uncultured Truepera sp. TaxID=543023 RepID=A0A6J4VD32_9DEIN|nr:MAG: hypothetical protein AVDCRST_MAG86-2155 [uncultured Truepera sp.]